MCTNTAILNNNFPNCSTNKTFITMSQCFLCPSLRTNQIPRRNQIRNAIQNLRNTQKPISNLYCAHLACNASKTTNIYIPIYVHMPPHWLACLRINAQCVPYITNYNAPEWNQHLDMQNHFGSTSEISCWSINEISEVDSTVCIKNEFANKQNSQE